MCGEYDLHDLHDPYNLYNLHVCFMNIPNVRLVCVHLFLQSGTYMFMYVRVNIFAQVQFTYLYILVLECRGMLIK
jgi:hypothetical protein